MKRALFLGLCATLACRQATEVPVTKAREAPASKPEAPVPKVPRLDPEFVRQAIDSGGPGAYELGHTYHGLGTWGPTGKAHGAVYVTTPFSRIAGAAAQARKKYQEFSVDNVSADMGAPELQVHAFPYTISTFVTNVEAVVIVKPGGEVIHPIRASSTDTDVTLPGRGMTAVFAIATLAEGNELRVVYSGDSPEYRVSLKPKDLR